MDCGRIYILADREIRGYDVREARLLAQENASIASGRMTGFLVGIWKYYQSSEGRAYAFFPRISLVSLSSCPQKRQVTGTKKSPSADTRCRI